MPFALDSVGAASTEALIALVGGLLVLAIPKPTCDLGFALAMRKPTAHQQSALRKPHVTIWWQISPNANASSSLR